MIALFKAVPLGWKFAIALAVVVAFAGTYVKGRVDGNQAVYAELEVKEARIQREASIASTDVLIAQAIALGTQQQKARSYVAEIRAAPPAPAGCNCGRTPAAVSGSRGVRALVPVDPEAGPAAPRAVPAPDAGR